MLSFIQHFKQPSLVTILPLLFIMGIVGFGIWFWSGPPTLQSTLTNSGKAGEAIIKSFNSPNQVVPTKTGSGFEIQDSLEGTAQNDPTGQNNFTINFPTQYADHITTVLPGEKTITIRDTNAKNTKGTLLSDRTNQKTKNNPAYIEYKIDERKTIYYSYQKDPISGEKKLKNWILYRNGTGTESESYQFENARIIVEKNGTATVYYQDQFPASQAVMPFSLPRPFYIDKDGGKVDLDWKLNEKSDTLSIDFSVATDKYPIVLDPTVVFSPSVTNAAWQATPANNTSTTLADYKTTVFTTGNYTSVGTDDTNYMTTTAINVPGAPTIGTATATGSTTATVAFTAPASDGGATITTYTAYPSSGGGGGTLSQAGSGTISVTGLTTGTAYTFTVKATNSVGQSAASSASGSITTYAVPGAPTIGTATQTGTTTATVAFTAPASDGGATITTYTAYPSSGGGSGTLSQAGSGTINVTGLTAATSYTFTVKATNSVGQSAASSASNSITTAAVPGQQAYTTVTAGTSWMVPIGVTSISVMCIGPGAAAGSSNGGGGGELRYKNNYTVESGYVYTVIVTSGVSSPIPGNTKFGGTIVIAVGGSGTTGGSGGTGDGGGNGGGGGFSSGGGGAGGYSGAGGSGGGSQSSGTAGTTNAAGGGGGTDTNGTGLGPLGGGGGGGVGIYGSGSAGAGGLKARGGVGGSSGVTGSNGSVGGGGMYGVGGSGGNYGGGGGSGLTPGGIGGAGSVGACRIIWPGNVRTFPSTRTADE